jgi:hypothetical protein
MVMIGTLTVQQLRLFAFEQNTFDTSSAIIACWR